MLVEEVYTGLSFVKFKGHRRASRITDAYEGGAVSGTWYVGVGGVKPGTSDDSSLMF